MSNETEIFKLHRQGQDKYVYLLLAAAGAAMGFALTQTNDAKLAWSQIPLALAAASWAASFMYGCHRLDLMDAGLYGNAELLRIERGAHDEFPPAAAPILREVLRNAASKPQRAGRRQFQLLISGAGLYVLWHVLEMALRT